jgi:quinol monooxygenase YgiN
MIRVTGTLTCATQADDDLVRSHIAQHIRLSRAEPGCVKFDVTPGMAGLVWVLDEAFVDRAAFDAHQSRTRASVWFERTRHMARDFQIDET